ncbi:N-lysine methyltransferase setd6 isoform X1 [Oryzias melastigma]|uniref:N-lysine methyltransferase SETD6 n=2 Tax=Oryzias melastigma TaxID=30732 RepID=A0A3B3DR66_ORYME|nr:N-lysine methyltransferase setd6 isoform X1 [Oryzias melastigma]
MATAAKRQKVDEGADLLHGFLQWCDTVGLHLSKKVCVRKEGTVADYGMLAKEDIEEGEVLFTIPRSALLYQRTTAVSALLEKEAESLQSSSSWVPLLLALLHEYTSPQSHWKPYLSLWPDFRRLDHPMFWSKEERDELLRGTGVPEAVDKDLSNIQREYEDVVLPFMIRHPDLWNPKRHTGELYTELVAFVMAYSFQEPQEDEDEDEEEKPPNPPMMVPMADILNHVSNHNANLEFSADSLKMVSVRRIRAGEEVFNTYGQMANWQLLHMYGFTEPYPNNSNDTADVPAANLHKAAVQAAQSDSERAMMEERWEMLSETMQDREAFIFSEHGCLTDSELHTALKIFCMSEEEFSDFKENEGWEEDDEDEEQISQAFSNDGLPGLKPSWKRLIHEAARLTVQSYGGGEDRDRVLMKDEEALKGLNSRQQRALQVRFGQRRILCRLMELTES